MHISQMLQEIGDYYYNAIRKTILDYILKDEQEVARLGIMEIFDPILDYGYNFYRGIEPDQNWRNAVIMAREEMYDKLVICNDASLEILEQWHTIFKKDFTLL